MTARPRPPPLPPAEARDLALPLHRRFTAQLVAWTLLAAVVPCTALGWFSYASARRALERQVRLRLLDVAERKAQRLEAWAETRRSALAVTARTERLVDALVRAEKGDDGGFATPGAELAVAPQLADLGVEDVFVISVRGRVLGAAANSALRGRDLSDPRFASSELARVAERARTVAETEFTDFSASATSSGTGVPRALLAAPVFASGRVVGVVVAEIDNAEVWRASADLNGLGDSGEVAIAGRVGGRATLLAPTRHAPNAAFGGVPVRDGSPAALALLGRRGDGPTIDERGVPVFAVWRYIPSLRWGLVTQIDEAEAFAPATDLERGSLALTALAAIAAAIVAILVARRVSRPVTALTREAERVAAGDLGQPVVVDGDDELARLAGAFNQMVAEVKRHTVGLENEVAARTHELAAANEELVQRGMRIRESVDLARQIEASMLPDPARAPRAIAEVALVWRPLDRVGGDLAFIEPTADGGFVAGVIDCTGHGVAAAMTAMFASATCSLAIATHGAEGPSAILRELDRRLSGAFERARQDGVWLGLDVALAMITEDAVRFVGAGLGLIYTTPAGEIVELPGRKRGLGYGARKREAPLVEARVRRDSVEDLYLLSDGILDEPAGPRGEGLGRTRFLEILRATRTPAERAPTFAEQVAAVDRAVCEARGARGQRDDVTLLAIRLAMRRAAAEGSS